MNSQIVPRVTYRLLFNKNFTFKHAIKFVPYFHALGISHCYSSPLLAAKPGSLHGYDVIDPHRINPEIGTLEEFEQFVKILHQHEMGLILDIVPHHMYIGDAGNIWWQDILENGSASIYAKYFDIDWHPLKAIFDNKVYLPLLLDYYDLALKKGEIRVDYESGRLMIRLPYINLPTDPKSWIMILDEILSETEKKMAEKHEGLIELQQIITSLKDLSTTAEDDITKNKKRYEQIQYIKNSLSHFFIHHGDILTMLIEQLKVLNQSPSLLDKFLNAQSYRLCFWRVANDEINYRRFFDIFEYASICVEEPSVFLDTHQLIFKFLKLGWLDGLRIDYVDGLWDPQKYLEDVREFAGSPDQFYMIVEKILSGNEKLRPEWPIQGTVGYDFLNQLNGLYVFKEIGEPLVEVYKRFTGVTSYAFECKSECKKLITNTSFASECQALTRLLHLIAQGHRSSQDYTYESLRIGLTDVLAWFPVYRSYVRAAQHQIHEEDRDCITAAVNRSKRHNKMIDSSVYDYIQNVLLLEYPAELEAKHKIKWEKFVMRFQQVTGPIMAKGLEDTAFYRLYPLASLNEVGSELGSYGISKESFHKKNLERMEFWPHSMLSTMTHDAKRSADVRARINVLSEIPDAWEQAIFHWNKLNEKHKLHSEKGLAPDRNEEYLLYQILIGSWPLEKLELDTYVKRIQGYMQKALYEAKLNTNRINPDKAYEEGVQAFIGKILNPELSREFLSSFIDFFSKIRDFGMLNSLSQLLIKMTSPGVPDIYQGDEIWDYRLVDPDNRGAIDFSKRQHLLDEIGESSFDFYQSLKTPEDGKIKLFITQQALRLRRELPELFSQGLYVPLKIEGKMQNNLLAFARVFKNEIVIVVSGRFFTQFMKNFSCYKEGESPWEDIQIALPVEWGQLELINVFTGEVVKSSTAVSRILVKDLLKEFPLALLHGRIE